ncbi:hypothetical protein ACLEUK_01370 [Pseudescherichia vulneris]
MSEEIISPSDWYSPVEEVTYIITDSGYDLATDSRVQGHILNRGDTISFSPSGSVTIKHHNHAIPRVNGRITSKHDAAETNMIVFSERYATDIEYICAPAGYGNDVVQKGAVIRRLV